MFFSQLDCARSVTTTSNFSLYYSQCQLAKVKQFRQQREVADKPWVTLLNWATTNHADYNR
ncbi:uncharacterized protein PHALS_14709 [Plasmopara halstedii]|uniref:Uncharacterized protein n=1 Tax=Plasmopara halstedii TaxID=4781 RepID=A0A0P1AR86_PLAHL|nr:uncharacterized protein PHALS_14709 [Plasmopara halstedii]CEG43425.1 hypothetical protein PHALS_14709 [Plasmopara halstedii]|eukprot:XP_024579794.1 hypothetical protein PHALS_14709 [Plasmopara halstedii]